MRAGHWFAGAGGSLYAGKILGWQSVLAVEWDRNRCDMLEERRDEGWFPGLHVHCGDARLFDPYSYAGRLDIITAGWPCRDISVAGGGAGLAGEHSRLYFAARDAVRIVRPLFVFYENSPAIADGRGLVTVLSDLAEMGYDARWLTLGADTVGAPHQRDRWWCLAYLPDPDRTRELQRQGSIGAEWRWAMDVSAKDADLDRKRQHQAWTRRTAQAYRRGSPNAERRGWWSVEPPMGRMVHGLAHGRHQIEALGDGWVPMQAATAYALLGGPLT